MQLREHVPLAPYTTLGLGGPAQYFCECASEAEVRDALALARRRDLRVQIIGGASNVIFADAGFAGLVVKVTVGGVAFRDTGDAVEVNAGAGVEWDLLVREAVERGCTGIECLSGIPGTVGGTPIQNVGAYGQEIADTLVAVTCLERERLTRVELRREQCELAYRDSRFKRRDRDRYVVLDVTLRLRRGMAPRLRYPELEQAVRQRGDLEALDPGNAVKVVRETVLGLRRRKSMVLDPTDPNARSVGSFFVNPVLPAEAFDELVRRWRATGGDDAVPTIPGRWTREGPSGLAGRARRVCEGAPARWSGDLDAPRARARQRRRHDRGPALARRRHRAGGAPALWDPAGTRARGGGIATVSAA